MSVCYHCKHFHWRASFALYGWWDESCEHPQRTADWPIAGHAVECPGYQRWQPMSKFEKALAYVFDVEKLFSNHPLDRGGPTMYGITQVTYDSWRRARALAPKAVSSLSRDEAKEIYRQWFWDAAGCELLPETLATCAFDAMVNHRPKVAIGLMQKTLGVPADGMIGPVTQKAYREAQDGAQLIWKFVDARLDLYATIVVEDPTQLAFLKGWLRRAHALERLLWPSANSG